jgi:mono/diheme cytochrome c family protein
MHQFFRIFNVCLLVAVVCAVWAQAPQIRRASGETGIVSPDEIQSLLAASCVSCHSGAQPAGGLRLDSISGVAKGGKSGPVVLPGNASASPLFQRVVTTDRNVRMPLAIAPLTAEKIALLKSWIEDGADGMPRLNTVDFVRDVKPILEASCFGCHSGPSPKSQLRLDSRAGAIKGGLGGPAIVAGNSEASRLVHRVEGRGNEKQMPLAGTPLRAEQIATLKKWIDGGAVWPVTAGTVTASQKHWSFVHPARPTVPSVKGVVRTPIDNFILARLEKEKLGFSTEASKETLIRRVSLDLTGLPPSLEEIDAFVADNRPDAYDRLVERLLASSHYGERWARPWLDLARYADTNGYEADRRRTMWKYRDWVIDALNRDMPFDQFTIEQIAGDMLPGATSVQKVATGFHRNTMYNEEGGVDKEEAHFEVLVDRVNTTATVWLGSTIGCAQCHNHKYDPFSQKEYYQLMAFFANSARDMSPTEASNKGKEPVLDLATPEQERARQKFKAEIDALELKLKTQTPELAKAQAAWERKQIEAASEWKPVQTSAMHSLAGTALSAAPNGAILASGKNPQNETYVIEGEVPLGKLSGLRLEALPHEQLPRGGPGRDIYGNAIVSEIKVEIGTNGGGWQPIQFKRTLSDDGRTQDERTKKLWIIDASREDKRLPRQLVLIPAEPVKLKGNPRLRISIRQDSDFVGQSIGYFRLSATDTKDPSEIVKLRAKQRPILETPAKDRTEDESKQLAEQFRAVAKELESARDRLKELKKQVDRLGIATALVMGEQPGVDRPSDFVRIRGGFANKDENVYGGIPAVLGSLPAGAPPNRMGLAQWLVSKENPLTARVAVNRMWEQFFGRGLVETSEDFGSQGERPTHPELLDWLAVEFMDRNWSMKAMHRLIVTSAAYRQSSAITPELLRADPFNRLISRGARFRLAAESVRDVALAASGLLSQKIGGPSVFPPQPPGVWDLPYNDEKWEESKGEDRYRRGIYTFVRRSALHPAMMNFDATSREFCTVRRIRTNTPLQALTTLNDEGFFEMAQALARRIVRDGGKDDRSRISYGFRLSTGRLPKAGESDSILAWLAQEKQKPVAKESLARLAPDFKDSLAPAYVMLANVLLNLDEALTKE